MKTTNTLFVSFLLSTTIFFAQNKNSITEKISIENYAELKSKGLLKHNVNYAIGGSQAQLTEIQALSSITSNNNIGNSLTRIATVDSCSCFQMADSTFNIVPFTSGMAPDYRNDDGSSAAISLPFNFCFYGAVYNSCYINNNGNITFSGPVASFSATGFPTTTAFPMIAPFWADVDTRLSSVVGQQISGLVRYKVTPHYMLVTWDSVGYYAQHADKRCTFQVIISDGTDSIIKGSGNVVFCYGDMQWTTGDASTGIQGFGGVPATAGFDKGDGIKFAQLGRFDQVGFAYDGPVGNSDGVDWLDNKSFNFNTCATNNFPPVSIDSTNACEIVYNYNLFDTIFIESKFIGPEIGQTIALSANFPPNVSGFFIKSTNNGTIGKMKIGIVSDGTNVGTHYCSITATDNGSPSQSSSNFFIIKIDTIGSLGISNSLNLPKFDFKIFPNPSTGIFNLDLPSSFKNHKIVVSDVFGRIVFADKNRRQIDLHSLKSGVYSISVTNGVSIFEKTIILNH
jgi:Secretion system C-terminal sorting domain/Nidogen-like